MCAVSILTIYILHKCTKLTSQIRLMAIHLTVNNLAFSVLFLSGVAYATYNGSKCTAIHQTTALPLVLFNIFLTAAGFDRLFSLKYSIKYTLWAKKQNACAMIASLYVIGICLHIPHLPPYLQFSCKEDKHIFTYGGFWSFVTSSLVLIACDIVIYFYIGVIAMKAKVSNQTTGRNDYSRFSLATLKSFVLSIVTIVLLGPFVISSAVQLCYFNDFVPDNSTLMVVNVLAIFHQILSSVLILVSYKECRFHLAVLCLCCCKDKRQTIERDYKQHYATFAIAPLRNDVHLLP